MLDEITTPLKDEHSDPFAGLPLSKEEAVRRIEAFLCFAMPKWFEEGCVTFLNVKFETVGGLESCLHFTYRLDFPEAEAVVHTVLDMALQDLQRFLPVALAISMEVFK